MFKGGNSGLFTFLIIELVYLGLNLSEFFNKILNPRIVGF
jgi:hypothetical protein